MTKCYGDNCPLKLDCFRFTQPASIRDSFENAPYDDDMKACKHFVSNIPDEEFIRLTAYYLWQREDCPEGKSLEIWEKARYSCFTQTGRAYTRHKH